MDGFRIAMLVFYTPAEKVMKVSEAQKRGYGVGNVATRLLLRGPTSSPETYTQDVSGSHFTGFPCPPFRQTLVKLLAAH